MAWDKLKKLCPSAWLRYKRDPKLTYRLDAHQVNCYRLQGTVIDNLKLLRSSKPAEMRMLR